MTKSMGKKKRLALFEINLMILKRMVNVTDPSKSGVFGRGIITESLHKDTVESVKKSFEIWRQEDISSLKTMLYHLDPCEKKSNYRSRVDAICVWADPQKRI